MTERQCGLLDQPACRLRRRDGFRRTHEERLRLLREAGVEGKQLAALCFSIGLGLGARTPEETAVSITSEIIAHANGASGLPLSLGTGPIHRSAAARDIARRKHLDRTIPRHVR